MENITQTQFDHWLSEGSSYAALVLQQHLMPLEGKEFGVIFPPTYAPPEDMSQEDKKKWTGYNIDYLPNGSTICQIDSVGSQANRVEPIFKREPFSKLVPQIIVTASDKKINLLDAGHRAADAILRFSQAEESISKAYLALRDKGDAVPLAKIAPTSIVFGSWDSRATQVRLPRIFRSEIRAYNVDPIHRSAQFTTSAGQFLESEESKTKEEQEIKSYLGLSHAPASWKHGGVVLRKDGQIIRSTVVNFVAIRSLFSTDENQTLNLRRYILGLSMIALTSPLETFLREGCQLVLDPVVSPNSTSELIQNNGTIQNYLVDATTAQKYAEIAKDIFNPNINDQSYVFDVDTARKQTKIKKDAIKKEVEIRLKKLAKEV